MAARSRQPHEALRRDRIYRYYRLCGLGKTKKIGEPIDSSSRPVIGANWATAALIDEKAHENVLDRQSPGKLRY